MATIQTPGDVDFTYDWYRDFLGAFADRTVAFEAVSNHLDAGEVLVRHDVDLSVESALRMARLEADLGVEATYCFLLTSPLYNLLDAEQAEMVREIDRLGHEVALHFDTHSYWEGEPAEMALEDRVRAERSIMESVVPDVSSTVSFHRPPPWVLDRRFSGFTNAYSPEFFGDTTYVADSNQRWRDDPPTIDDSDVVQLLTHPGLWGESEDTFDGRIHSAIIEGNLSSTRRAEAEFLDGGMNQ